jgi:hypothetical protein
VLRRYANVHNHVVLKVFVRRNEDMAIRVLEAHAVIRVQAERILNSGKYHVERVARRDHNTYRHMESVFQDVLLAQNELECDMLPLLDQWECRGRSVGRSECLILLQFRLRC